MTDKLQLTGTYLGAMKTELVGQNGFRVRKFYLDITTNVQYPNTPEFKLKGDNVALVDNLQKGQMIIVHFWPNGRKWEKDGKKGVSVDLDCYKIEVINLTSAAALATPAPTSAPVAAAAPVPAARPAAPPVPPVSAPGGFAQPNGEDDDLPF